MIINLVRDSSVASAPAGFMLAVQNAANAIAAVVTNNITVNIAVGWDEINGVPMTGNNALGGPATGIGLSYSAISNALANSATSTADAVAGASLLAASQNPNGDGLVFVSRAQEKALGVTTNGVGANDATIDGSIGVSAGILSYNWFAAALHEITHAMGRMSGYSSFGIEDLFRYSSPGVHSYAGGPAAYFSIDGGVTNIASFDTSPDYGDWASSTPNDPFDAIANGIPTSLTPADLQTLDAIGYSLAPIASSTRRGAAAVADTLTGSSGNDAFDGGDAFFLTPSGGSIFRLYGAALARAPDLAGFNGWTAAMAGGLSLSAAAGGFVNSAEFQSAYGALDATAFVTLLYRNVLGRTPDPTGLTGWVGFLNGGMSRADVLLGFSESAENKTNNVYAVEGFATGVADQAIFGEVFRLYEATLRRGPDPLGYMSWTTAMENGKSLQDVAAGFVNSAEFNGTYGALGNNAFVTLLYSNVLGRSPDPAGFASWVNSLNGGMSRQSVVLGFSESAEFQSLEAAPLANFMKTTMAASWSDTLAGGGGANKLLGGAGANAYVFAKADATGGVNVVDDVYGVQTWDTINLRGFGYASASDALGHMTQSGSDVIFNAGLASGSNTTIDFHATTLAVLTAATYSFV